MNVAEEKAALRRRLLEARVALAPDQVASKSADIAARLDTLPEIGPDTAILTYVSTGSEVDTQKPIERWMKSGRMLYVPAVADGAALVWNKLIDFEALSTGKMGVPEMENALFSVVEPPDSATVLVPGVAFTADGARPGRGSGCFDRFLTGHGGPKIGLAFDLQIVETVPEEPHDERVDVVITESRIYRAPA